MQLAVGKLNAEWTGGLCGLTTDRLTGRALTLDPGRAD